MSVPRRVYPRPPIVEAVIELRFDDEIDHVSLADELGSRLSEQYRGERQQQRGMEASVNLKDGSSSVREIPGPLFLRSADHLRLLGLTPTTLSAHALAPYPGWESFIEQAREAIAALPAPAQARQVRAVAVRYIDRFVLPQDSKLDEFLTVLPPTPKGVPLNLTGFHFASQANDPDGARVVLTAASVSHEGADAVIYDILLEASGEPLCELSGGGWETRAESLHARQRDIFEASITDKMRELFS